MKAAQLSDYGPTENFSIVDLPKPAPGPRDVLVKAEVAGLRWGDIMGRTGIPVRSRAVPFVPGQEAAGVVAENGEGATRFAPGDRIFCLPRGTPTRST